MTGKDIVVGKSMAMRRRDLEALGNFATVKDVLAEDFILGHMVPARLGKRVASSLMPVVNHTSSVTTSRRFSNVTSAGPSSIARPWAYHCTWQKFFSTRWRWARSP